MLIDTREKQPENGFQPTVQNQVIEAKVTGGAKAGVIIMCILTLGLFYFYIISVRNWFNEKQMKVNESASGIDVTLTQRKETLVKLIEATKGHMKYEKEVLTQVTALRTSKVDASNRQEIDAATSNVLRSVMINVEKYPDLKVQESVSKLMNSIDYLEREIGASRRLYNAIVNEFNQRLFVFPASVVAAKSKLTTLPLFVASAEQKADVKVDLNF